MGGVVVLVRWCKHLSGARYLFMGMILPQLGGNGGMGCDSEALPPTADRVLGGGIDVGAKHSDD